jgi:hypothetical protein
MAELMNWIDQSLFTAADAAAAVRPRLQHLLQGAHLELPADLKIESTSLVFAPGRDELDTLVFQITEQGRGRTWSGYRAVRLLHMASIPLNVRGDQGALARMRTVLRGLYNAGLEIVYLVAGIYHPERLGIVQCYGAIGQGTDRSDAAAQAAHGAASLEAAMAAAYPQMRFCPLDSALAAWIGDALLQMPYGVLAVGQPDPRQNARGGESDLDPLLAAGKHPHQEYTLQQNELVMRGMAQLEEDFLLQVLLTPVARQAASSMLAGLAEYTSTWAAWQTGQRTFSLGTSLPLMLSGTLAHSAGAGFATATSSGQAEGSTHTTSQSRTTGQASSQTSGVSITDGSSSTRTTGSAQSTSQSVYSGRTLGSSASETQGQGWNVGGSVGVPGVASVNAGYNAFNSASQGSFSSSSRSVSSGTTSTRSESSSQTSSHSVTENRSQTETTSRSDMLGESNGSTHTDSQTASQSQAQNLSSGISQGIAFGLAPSFSLGDSNQWQFDPAILLTTLLRQQEQLLNTITLEGGFYTDVYALAASERGRAALLALIPEAFQGTEEVVTGVQTRTLSPAEDRYLRLHARALVPSKRAVHLPEALTAYADSTLLTLLQASAYMTPGLFEEGLARTVQEAIPPFAFNPRMEGDVVLGRLYSSERGLLTSSLLRLSPERHFHTAFASDTGFGKSVAAERLAYETTLHWHYRTVVLDFGQGWRRALHWPGMAGRVDIRQLHPGGVRPIRWNPLQVPKRIDPSRYRTLVCELLANAGRMGPRQLGFLRDRLTRLYQQHGVLPLDPGSDFSEQPERSHPVEPAKWQVVVDESEQSSINQTRRERGLAERSCLQAAVTSLEPFERQALAVHRSRAASLAAWVALLQEEFARATRARDQSSRSSLQGVLLRLEPLAEGEMQYMYGPGHDSLAVEDLGLLGPARDPWGVTVIEGGAEMDEFSKSALLSLAASILYLDSVVRRREALNGARFPPMQIFFEEANKVLSGVDLGSASDREGSSADQTAQIFLDMWRDGRKYQCFLHVLAQTISELPPGILSSCNNGFFGQTKNDRDRQAILAHLARSNKGFVNAEYDRFLARMPIGMAIAKLGYTGEMIQTEPTLVRPLMLEVAEPDDSEILRAFHRPGVSA